MKVTPLNTLPSVILTWKFVKITLPLESHSEQGISVQQQNQNLRPDIGPAKSGKPMSLVKNMNARKKAKTSRSKAKSTISPKAYAAMKSGWPKKAKKK